ncbi:GDP-mannose 4,6 dehydratase [Microtus ochrogaster]|uniref:GDP-mannose 4,6-dehydratase n=1 Tax=Microtus ochrogaster TaxID=79684 RepID=A0A8J6KQ11_MICOH|nr:GDP-mannose 4,6 dehydratase [Microtus ochrogaster]
MAHPVTGRVVPHVNRKAMWLMLQNDEPEDFVIATGEVHSVREFVEKSFMYIGKTIVWEGKNENEVGRCKETGQVHVTVDLKYYRPTEVVRTPSPPSV